jgi:hypothetical protein
LILLDELAFYLIHASSQGSKDEGTIYHSPKTSPGRNCYTHGAL